VRLIMKLDASGLPTTAPAAYGKSPIELSQSSANPASSSSDTSAKRDPPLAKRQDVGRALLAPAVFGEPLSLAILFLSPLDWRRQL